MSSARKIPLARSISTSIDPRKRRVKGFAIATILAIGAGTFQFSDKALAFLRNHFDLRSIEALAGRPKGYAYYETRRGYESEVGRLLPVNASMMPEFDEIRSGRILRTNAEVTPIRENATRGARAVHFATQGTCLKVLSVGPALKPTKASSGGWLEVSMASCPKA